MILITTPGKVGSEAARLLAARDEPVRVLARDPNRAQALIGAGVDVVRADLTVPETIDAAMSGVSRIVLISPPSVEMEINVIDSARRAGVAHVVKITSKASADSPIARRRQQAEIEAGLSASGLSHTLLRNNAYMQNFLMMAPGIARENSFSNATGEGRVAHLDARDVAAVAAEIAVSPHEHAGKTYWPTGPQALSSAEVAEVLSHVLGRTITYQPISYEQQKQAMTAVGLPETVAEDNARAVTMMADGDCDYITEDVTKLLGRSASTFEEFATDFKAAFA